MPKVSTSTRGKKGSKDATEIRKLRKSRFRGIFEEVIEPVEPGKLGPLKRTPKDNMPVDCQCFGHKIEANSEEKRPVSGVSVPAQVYSVNLNAPRITVQTSKSEATAKWKDVAASVVTDDDDDDVDESEDSDLIMVPAGLVELTEILGDLVLLNTPATQTAPSPMQSSHMVPEPMLVELVNNNEPCMPAASIPESFQDTIWPSAGPEAFFYFQQQDIQNHFHLGSTDNDIDMISVGEAMIETPNYSIPWTSQPERYSQIDQVTDNTNQYQLETYTMHDIHVNWASMFQPMQSESNHMNQLQFNHPVDPLAVAISKSLTTVPVIIESTPTQSDEQPDEEPSKTTKTDLPICLDSHPGGRQNRACIIQPNPGHRRWGNPPVRSEMDLVAHLTRVELEGHSAPQAERRNLKQRHKDSQPEYAHTDFEAPALVPPRQQRYCEPDISKLKTLPVQKRSYKYQDHQQHQVSMKEPASSQTPTEWNFSGFFPSITSLVDRSLQFF